MTAPSALGALNPHGHLPCAIPRRWRLVAQDGQAVVIRQRHAYPAYQYCNRGVGRWRSMVAADSEQTTGPPYPLRLAGRFVAYRDTYGYLYLWDTRTGGHNQTPAGTLIGGFSDFLFSPDGVVARFTDTALTNIHRGAVALETLSVRSWDFELVSVAPENAPADLQLFDCSAGCQPNTVIVSWTDQAGQTQYKQVTGGD